MVELFANSGDPDQMPCSVASDLSDLGLHFSPFTLLGVYRLQWLDILIRVMFSIKLKSQDGGMLAI